MVDESTPPQTLSERSISAIADYIKSGNVKRIVVMTGAGISTAAGSECYPSSPAISAADILPYSSGFQITEDWTLQQPRALKPSSCRSRV